MFGENLCTVCPRKKYNRTFRINNFKIIETDQCIISGYECITYYLPFAGNRIRIGQVYIVTQKYEHS